MLFRLVNPITTSAKNNNTKQNIGTYLVKFLQGLVDSFTLDVGARLELFDVATTADGGLDRRAVLLDNAFPTRECFLRGATFGQYTAISGETRGSIRRRPTFADRAFMAWYASESPRVTSSVVAYKSHTRSLSLSLKHGGSV